MTSTATTSPAVTIDNLTVRESAAVRTVVAVFEIMKADNLLGMEAGAGELFACTDLARRLETNVGQVVNLWQEGREIIAAHLAGTR